MPKRILIIENQFIQFRQIALKLQEYEIFPDYDKRDEYNALMERVRIWLYGGYHHKRRTECLAFIIEYIEILHIDLFIIDYKLSGSSEGGTGIDLGLELRGKFSETPIIFLSRTPQTKELELGRFADKSFDWVEKGYSSVPLADNAYFNKYMKPAIVSLLNGAYKILATHKIRLETLRKWDFITAEYGAFLEALTLDENPDHETIELVIRLEKGKSLEDEEIKLLIQNTQRWKKFTSS